MKFLDFISYINRESDPFYSRELILIFMGVDISFNDLFFKGLTYTDKYIISSVGGIFFVISFIYVIILAANNSRLIESGSFSFLLLMPLGRLKLISSRLIFPTLMTTLLFSSLLIASMILASFTIYPDLLLLIMTVFLSTFFMYLSISYVISFLTRNTVLTFAFLFSLFTLENIYAEKIERIHVINVTLLGDLAISSKNIFTTFTYAGILAAIITGLFGLILQYYILKKINLRSGR